MRRGTRAKRRRFAWGRRTFLARRPVQLLTVFDAKPAPTSNALYGTFAYPETYVIDKSGVVRRKFIGPQEWTSPEIVDYLRKIRDRD